MSNRRTGPKVPKAEAAIVESTLAFMARAAEGKGDRVRGIGVKVCSLCGRVFDTMEGQVTDAEGVHDLCHPFDTPPMSTTCYQRWTVYGVRPAHGDDDD